MTTSPENASWPAEPGQAPDSLAVAWGADLSSRHCPACEWAFLAPPGLPATRCPHCGQAELMTAGQDSLSLARPPELVVPYAIEPARLADQVQRFSQGIPFAPTDLNAANLRQRARPVYLPHWLVDINVQAEWQAEAGFDYEAISHRERYQAGRWVTQEVNERRVRWEPRLGQIERHYANTAAPALEDQATVDRRLGEFDLTGALAYRAEAVQGALVRLPDRPPQDAWVDAEPVVKARAATDCQAACRADHWRQFRWSPRFDGVRWTLLLLPAYATFYHDDEGQPRLVWIHGQSGRIAGQRRASRRRARQASLLIGVVALLVGLLGLVLTVLGAPLVGIPALGLGVIAALSAIWPLFQVWRFNQAQERTPRPMRSI